MLAIQGFADENIASISKNQSDDSASVNSNSNANSSDGRVKIVATAVNVLIVDDDPDIRELLSDYLSDNGFVVATAIDADSMHERIEKVVPDVVLMDIGLPGEDGLSLTRYLRERLDIGVIVISGAGDTIDRIVGLEVGADDFIAKPFDPRELRARIKSVVRRYQRPTPEADSTIEPSAQNKSSASKKSTQDEEEKVNLGLSILNLQTRQLHNTDGAEIPLTAMEFELLKTFISRPNRPMTRDQLLNITQNRDWDPYDRSIDIRITRLRRKIELDPGKPQILRTVRGVGYMFVPVTPVTSVAE